MLTFLRIRCRSPWQLFIPVTALAALISSCSDKPTAAPFATIEQRAALLNQPIAGDPTTFTSGASLRYSGGTIAALATSFTAAPFAADYVVTGAEGGDGGEHYQPSNGDGTFGSKSNIPGLGNVDGMDVADMDGDGDNDFLACDGSSGETHLYVNGGSGSFTPAVVATGVASSFCTNLRVSDFNADGRNDFVVGDETLGAGMFVYLQSSAGTFEKVTSGLDVSSWNANGSLFGVAAGDVDGDGNRDVLVLGYFGTGHGDVRLFKGDGTGAMAASVRLFNVDSDFGTSGSVGLGLFDLEGDGDLDIVVGGGTSGGEHFVYTNDGSGGFARPSAAAFDVDAQSGIDAFDVDGDGDHDLLVAAFGTRKLHLVTNNGGSLAAPAVISDLDGSSIGIGAPPIEETPGESSERIPANSTETAQITVEEDGDGNGNPSPVAGIVIPPNTFNEDVTVTVRVVDVTPEAPCHDFLIQQTGKCVEITAKNDLGQDATLNNNVIVGVCLPADAHIEIYKWDDPQGRAIPLRQVAFDVDCSDAEFASAQPRNWLEGLAMGVSKRVGGWISPKLAYAADRGFGGEVLRDGGLSTFMWAAPVQLLRSGLAVNFFGTGKDAFGVEGTFSMAGKDDDPFKDEAGFDPLSTNTAANMVTVAYGDHVETIPQAGWRFVRLTQRWTYVSAKLTGVNYMDLNPVTGEFRVLGRTATKGDALPTGRSFTIQIGHRIRGHFLECAANGSCTGAHQ